MQAIEQNGMSAGYRIEQMQGIEQDIKIIEIEQNKCKEQNKIC